MTDEPTGLITEMVISQNSPREFEMKLGAEHDGTPFYWVPYPGWRFVPTGDGGMRHEKIPPVWQRIKSFLRGGE